jgi:thioredoxin 1
MLCPPACAGRAAGKDGSMSGSITHLSEATFAEQVNSSDEPVLVDFWAEWCVPCHKIAPVLEELAVEKADRLRIAKVDVDENRSLALEHRVQSIPTMILFKDGVEVHRITGAVGKAKLLEDLQPLL